MSSVASGQTGNQSYQVLKIKVLDREAWGASGWRHLLTPPGGSFCIQGGWTLSCVPPPLGGTVSSVTNCSSKESTFPGPVSSQHVVRRGVQGPASVVGRTRAAWAPSLQLTRVRGGRGVSCNLGSVLTRVVSALNGRTHTWCGRVVVGKRQHSRASRRRGCPRTTSLLQGQGLQSAASMGREEAGRGG